MKTLCATLLLSSVCVLSTLQADVTIVQKVEGMGQDMESTTEIKGGKTRVDASPETSIIVDPKSGDMISLMRAQKKYVKVPSQMAEAALASMQKAQGDQPAPSLTPTGKKETINGFATEEYTCNVGGSKVSLWLTKALPDYQAVLKEMAATFNHGPMSAMMKNMGVDFGTLPGFPIRTVNQTEGQMISSTVVSVSTKAISDADFDVPADYQEMKMPSLTPPAAEQAPAVSK